MFEFKTSAPNNDQQSPNSSSSRSTPATNQQRLMATALLLLIGTLVFVLYRDRDFWFPDAQESEEQSEPIPAVAATTPSEHPVSMAKTHTHAQPVAATVPEAPPLPGTTITRTVLPPLEVEVVAGTAHQLLRPGSNSVQIDLERGSAPPTIASKVAPQDPPETAAGVTNKAAERVQVSAQAASVVTHSVTPGYPTLARQMKVQGSVILQALIGRDGLIQDLHVLSGPPILANAAQEAVRQWHFKPHYQGSDPVETQAKITVNFTISTN
jgi:protein TonB